MSSKKKCSYKNCTQGPNRTLFRFPVEKERFIVWCANSGIKSDVLDINEPRFLCEHHFSPNYIASQARRKMLVHTAIPKQFTEDVQVNPDDFKVVGEPVSKKRKMRNIPIIDLLEKPQHNLDENISNSSEVALISVEDVEENTEASTSHGSYKMKEVEQKCDSSTNQQNYQVVIVPSSSSSKTKKKTDCEKYIINEIPEEFAGINDQQDDIFYFSEETDIPNSTNFKIDDANKDEITPSTSKKVEKCEDLEGYSEFIYNSEKYVQMPKRVFEAEKQKLMHETKKYRDMLKKLKSIINSEINF